MRRFKECLELESLRRLTADARVEIRAYSRLAFRQLLNAKRPITELLHFLEDPTLNNPKAKNLRFFLYWLVNGRLGDIKKSDFSNLLAPWVRQQTCLGKFTRDDIQCLTECASSLTQSSRDKALKTDLLEAMITGLEECSLMGVSDLLGSTLERLLDCLSSADSLSRSLSLACRVLKGLHEAQLRQLHTNLQKFILRIFQAYLDSKAPAMLDSKSDFAQIVFLIPDDMKARIINQTSKMLIDQATSDSSSDILSSSKLLKIWWSILKEHGLFELTLQGGSRACVPYHILRKPLAIVAPYLYYLDDRRIALILLQYWWRPPRRVRDEYNRRLLQDDINEPFSLMVKIAQDHLPVSSKPFLTKSLFKLLQSMHRHDIILDIVGHASQNQITLSPFEISSLIREYTSINPRYACKLFWSSPQLRMENFPELAEYMIDNIRLHPNTVWHNIRHRDCVRISNVDQPRWREDRARLLERIARRYAKAKHLSARMSFRHIYRCYIYHKKDKLGPVGKDLSRSLTRTGVIRPLQRKQWVSSVKLRWILSVVRAAEGDDVAEKLDQLVYEWRQSHIRPRQVMAHHKRICEAPYGPMEFQVRHQWCWRRRYPVKSFIPIKYANAVVTNELG